MLEISANRLELGGNKTVMIVRVDEEGDEPLNYIGMPDPVVLEALKEIITDMEKKTAKAAKRAARNA